ncbi:R2-like ligand-binding oxidase [Candidatus Sumerlaeota bacterium]|nr:R2-like ligand-binding oxidase [Candidatus Sumerlaeota bacterium]
MPIQMDAFPMRLFRQSRELAWDPLEIDYTQDKKDWDRLNSEQQDFLVRMVLGFLIGERGVTHDLAPLQQALRRERHRMEEEMFLTMQLMEESKHVEFFQLWMDEVLPGQVGEDIPFPPMQGNVFSHVLPQTLGALLTDRSAKAQLSATLLYHQVVEGVLGETGYQLFYGAFEKGGFMPGLLKGVHLIQRDEVRHIAFGTYLAQRILKENPDLEGHFESEMERFRPHGEGIATQIFVGYPKDKIPFNLDPKWIQTLNRQLHDSRVNNVRKGQLLAV